MDAAARRRLLDLLPSALLIAIGIGQLLAAYDGSGYRGSQLGNAAFATAIALPLVFRRSRPALALAAVFAVQAAWILAWYNGRNQPPLEPFLAGVAACFALGYHADRRDFRIGLSCFAVMVVATAAVLALGDASVGNALPVLIWWILAIAFGRVLRERQRLVELLRERSAVLERERDRDIAEATFEERARIARELHDVIAHAVSLIVIQAAAERRASGSGDERVARTLETIEDAGREALGELRRLLGVLRAPGSERLAPQPGLGSLDQLIDESRRGGGSVDFSETGDTVALSPGLDLAAYRIVQEGLTNARKHAPGAPVGVALRWGRGELEIEVTDHGPGPTGDGATGHGLIGMRERAELYGGSVVAEAAEPRGFRVRARLPLDDGGGA